MNQTPTKLIYLVVGSLASLALIGMVSLCLSMFYKSWADPAILTAVITLTSGAVSAVGAILSSPRSAVTSTTSTVAEDGSKTTVTAPVVMAPVATAPTAAEPMPVNVVNPPSDPVPTTEAQKK